MTGLLIVIAATALLILALEPAHRRAQHDCAAPFRPGADLTVDRDRERVVTEIATITRPDPARPAQVTHPGPGWAATPLRCVDPRLSQR